MTATPSTDTMTDPSPSPAASSTPPPAKRWTPSPRERWERPALIALLVLTAAAYVWDLSASGWANSFYSAAVQAGSESWSAFFFGASDAAGSITVDKPPASLWIMALSVRIFGLSSWSILIPQALMGVATVGVVYASVRRYFSAQAGLLAGAVLALTPVAALMFRFNNPDALLVLLLTLAVYVTLRAVEDGRTRWLVLAGVLVGLGFLTKQLQTLLIVPGIAVVYLFAAPVSLWRRIRDGLLAVVAMVVSAGWWVAIVELIPASARPYIGGSTNNSFLELTLGYNGLGRIFGRTASTGATGTGATGTGATGIGATGVGGGGGGGGGAMSSDVGLLRMFSGDLGGHVAWLIPAALILGAIGVVIVGRAARTDLRRASLLLWGATLVVTGLTFSLMDGTFHQYYTVALAPAIGALVGIGGWLLWTRRSERWALPAVAAVSLITTGWAFVILTRSPDWNPWLRWTVLAVGLLAVAGLLLGRWLGPKVVGAGITLALIAALAGPTSWTAYTVLTPHVGGAVTTGPVVEGSSGGPGVRGGQGTTGQAPPDGQGTTTGPGRTGQGRTGQGTTGQPPVGRGTSGQGTTGQPPVGQGTTGQTPTGQGGTAGEVTAVDDAMIAQLLSDADSFTWVAATTGAESAASYQLATEKSVMPIGGFRGDDPAPTLEEFQAYVSEGQIHYYIASGSGSGVGGGQQGGQQDGSSSTIATWVSESFTAQTVGGVTVYDLTAPAS